jgi:hypothetical protein
VVIWESSRKRSKSDQWKEKEDRVSTEQKGPILESPPIGSVLACPCILFSALIG